MSPNALGGLWEGDAAEVRPLGGEATYVRLNDGLELVLKGVPRQERPAWHPGQAWTELVLLDLLHSEGAPVPKLVAADPQAGWLLRTYEAGQDLGEALGAAPLLVFGALVQGLAQIEDILARFTAELAPHTVRDAPKAWSDLTAQVTRLLTPTAREAWAELVQHTLTYDALTLGPLDVNARNALWQGDGVCFLDFATLGPDFTERRLAAYGQVAWPAAATALTPEAYASYQATRGRDAALRLAVFDLMFWAVVIARLHVMEEQPESPAGARLRAVWGDPEPLWAGARAQWHRPRLDDARLSMVITGLSL